MRKGVGLIEILIVIAVVALLIAFALPKILGACRLANESAAQNTLKTISAALEAYASDNNGFYAPSDSVVNDKYLRTTTPPYLNKAYCGQVDNSYTFSCTINKTTYNLTARPQNCTTVGTKSFTVTTGGVSVIDQTCTPAGG
jgi:prepilin-type N-terminal cleavage/methylation domain-containing protein